MNGITNKLTTLPDNALDYLLSAIEHQEQRTERSFKYSILHLFAGIELLLKERLLREDWTLIFQHKEKANKAELNSGDLYSVNFKTSTKRLNSIGVNLTTSQLQHLNSLCRLRNRIQHFHAVIRQTDTTSRLAQGMNFAIHFVANEMPDLNTSHKRNLDLIHVSLATFNEYVSCRYNEIADKLSSYKCTVWCPLCGEETLGLGNGDPLCPFCGFTDEPFEAMTAVVGDSVIGECPGCRGPMGDYSEVFICFCCGTTAAS